MPNCFVACKIGEFESDFETDLVKAHKSCIVLTPLVESESSAEYCTKGGCCRVKVVHDQRVWLGMIPFVLW